MFKGLKTYLRAECLTTVFQSGYGKMFLIFTSRLIDTNNYVCLWIVYQDQLTAASLCSLRLSVLLMVFNST